MEKKQLAPGIVIYSNILDNHETIADLLEYGVSLNLATWKRPTIKPESKHGSFLPFELFVSIGDKSLTDTLTIGLAYNKNQAISEETPYPYSYISKLFFENFDPLEKDYMDEHRVSFLHHDPYSVLKYGAGQNFASHVDDSEEFPRKISLVYYINDNYDGGEINFTNFDISYKPKANEMIIFPSNYVYRHFVSEIKSGTRYSVASWIY